MWVGPIVGAHQLHGASRETDDCWKFLIFPRYDVLGYFFFVGSLESVLTPDEPRGIL